MTVSSPCRWSERRGTSAFWWTMPGLWQERNLWTHQIHWLKRHLRSTQWRISGSVTAELTAFLSGCVLNSALESVFCIFHVLFKLCAIFLCGCSSFFFFLCLLFCLVQTYKAFLPAMIANNHGHLVSIASSAGLIGVNGLAGVGLVTIVSLFHAIKSKNISFLTLRILHH